MDTSNCKLSGQYIWYKLMQINSKMIENSAILDICKENQHSTVKVGGDMYPTLLTSQGYNINIFNVIYNAYTLILQ